MRRTLDLFLFSRQALFFSAAFLFSRLLPRFLARVLGIALCLDPIFQGLGVGAIVGILQLFLRRVTRRSVFVVHVAVLVSPFVNFISKGTCADRNDQRGKAD